MRRAGTDAPTRVRSAARNTRGGAATRRLLGTVLVGLLALAPIRASAWKPFTHNYTGQQVRIAIDESRPEVQIGSEWYSIPPAAWTAIRNNMAYYYAGTVGPDGFPDLTYGQAVIHPGGTLITEGTGAWLKYLLDKAWEAYRNGDPEGEKILAFTYGFLTHAAGDVWGHTVVNEMAHGVFPAVGEILTNVEKAAEAIRHIIAEGYIGEATEGFDGNPAFENYLGIWTDNSTVGFDYAVPKKFIYETLVDPAALTPIRAVRGSYSAARGPIIGTFLEMRDGLNDFVPDPLPDPLDAAISAFDDTLDALEDVKNSCDFENISDLWNCPANLAELGFDLAIDSAEAFAEFFITATEDLAYAVLESYLNEWVKDIDSGLRDWSDLGLATTKGLFDAQARRNYQNDPSRFDTYDEPGKAAVGALDVVMEETTPFIEDHLLSMVGLPDAVGQVAEILGEIGDAVDDVLAYIGLPFKPIDEAKDKLVNYVKSLIENAIWDVLGVDIKALADILKSPARYMCASERSFELPFLGPTVVPLFPNQEHQRLDDYLLFTGDHHVQEQGIPLDCGRLQDGVKYSPASFSPITDTVVLGKMLLLDGPELNKLLGNLLHRTIVTYGSGDNVMGKSTTSDPWLALIDGDHGWRSNGLPAFVDRMGEKTGGNGNFPLWKSCVLRPAFRQLFIDWENPWVGGRGPGPSTARINFPELGDTALPDPANDPNPPTSILEAKGNVFVDPGTGNTFLGANAWLVLSAQDGPASWAFADSDVKLRYRVITSAGAPGFTYPGSCIVDAILLPTTDGAYTVEFQSSDPCHTFESPVETLPVGNPESLQSFQAFRDATPPVTTCESPPFGMTFATDATSSANFSLEDGPGSGVASFSATVDGDVFAPGPVPIARGGAIDMFRYWPGLRTVIVTGTDHLGNTGTTNCTFEVHATTGSLIANLNRARAEGSVPSADVFKGLMDKLVAANKSDLTGRVTPEINQLEAFVNQLLAQRGKGIVPLRADQLIAYARDLVTRLSRVASL